MTLEVIKIEISLTEDTPIIVVTYVDVISYVKDATFTNMCGPHAYRNKCMGKQNGIKMWITMLLSLKIWQKQLGFYR